MVMLVLWAGGAGLLALRYGLQRISLERMIRRAAIPGPGLAAQFEEARSALPRWWPIRLRVVEEGASPGVVGIFFPAVIAPGWLEAPAHQARAPFALRHEITHLRHGDTAADLIRRVFCAVYWFHPGVWWASQQWERATELACDCATVRGQSETHEYASYLLECSDRLRDRQNSAAVNMIVAPSKLGRRIHALLSSAQYPSALSQRSRWAFAITAAGLTTMGAGISGAPAERLPGERILEFPRPPIDAWLQIDGQQLKPYGKIFIEEGEHVALRVNRSQTPDLSFLDALPGDGIQELVFSGPLSESELQHVNHLTGLHSLVLAGTGVTDAGLARLTNLTQLVHIDLRATFVTDAGLANLRHMRQLESIDLGHTYVTDAGMPILGGFPALREIDLRRTEISDAGVRELAALRNIDHINLEDTGVTDEALQYMGDWPLLRNVELRYTQVSDSGAAYLSSHQGLTSLNLLDTKITKAGLASIATLHNLQWLGLPRTLGAVEVSQLETLPAYERLSNRFFDRSLHFSLSNARTGEPVSGARISFLFNPNSSAPDAGFHIGRIWTGPEGTAEIYVDFLREALLVITADTYVPIERSIQFDGAAAQEQAIALEPAILIGGTVVDPNGQPLAGASVSLNLPEAIGMDNGMPRNLEVHTNAQGQWTCTQAPGNLASIELRVDHPDFHHQKYDAHLMADELHGRTASTWVMPLLNSNFFVSGPDNVPVTRASVTVLNPYERHGYYASPLSDTMENGHVIEFGLEYGTHTVLVSAPGYESKIEEIDKKTWGGLLINVELVPQTPR